MEWKHYHRTNIAEMRFVTHEEVINGPTWMQEIGISISKADLDNGSPKTGDMIARNPQNHSDQWLVAKDYFDENFIEHYLSSNDKCSNMSFSEALDAAKTGKKVAREGWNGKGMWIAAGDGAKDLPASQFWNIHSRMHAEQNGGIASVDPYMIMRTASGSICMGWLASQADLFANDWTLAN